MKHNELIASLSERTGADTKQTETMLNAATETLSELLVNGNTVGIQGFGVFEVRQKSERLSVHPKTGVRSMIPPKLVVNFKQSNLLKDNLKAHEYEK
ncbi:MAG: HU family DNA-binding protein [Paludibacter sp.]|jgi:DNA-binding protein HU-beta|nr:HU family DNA-binding protein [Paludibacter sp.]